MNEEKVIAETLELKTPVSYTVKTKDGAETKSITSLDFARLQAADIEDVPATDMKVKDFFLPISRSTGVAVGVIRKLDSEDLMAAIGVIGGFLGNGQRTGESL